MKFGYLIVVSKNDKIDYHKMAAILAFSIKRTQKFQYDNVALVTDDKENIERYQNNWIYDKVMYWDRKNFWDGRSYMNTLTPWEYTICLDADMIMTRDISHQVDYFIKNCELYVCNRVLNFRGLESENETYRETFVKNNLPNLYSGFTFLKKSSSLVDTFFNMVKYITDRPTEFKNLYMENHKPSVMGTDEIFALAAQILGIEDQISYPLAFPRFAHMKPGIQGFDETFKWPIELGFYFNDNLDVKIGNYLQTDIIHYVDKDIDLSNLIDGYEIKYRKNFKL